MKKDSVTEKSLERGDLVATKDRPVYVGVILDGYRTRSTRLALIFGEYPNADTNMAETGHLVRIGQEEFMAIVAALGHHPGKTLIHIEQMLKS